MLPSQVNQNLFHRSTEEFLQSDPHLVALAKLRCQHAFNWWQDLDLSIPGIYILTGGRQIGKSTSCKLLIKQCLEQRAFQPEMMLYLPCDEIFDAKELSQVLRNFLANMGNDRFLLIIDEITFVKDWDRVIKALADEGYFTRGLCLLTGSDTLILKEAAMSFPGRRGIASQTDFHLYPLTFREYVDLRSPKGVDKPELMADYFQDYLQCGGYLRAINDLAEFGEILPATYITYEQWIRGDFLKQGKNEDYLLAILSTLMLIGVSQVSYTKITQKVGMMSKETCMDYMRLLERMDVLFNLQAFDQNTKRGFPRKERKFHLLDPFIYQTLYRWLQRESSFNHVIDESVLVESCVASHCQRMSKSFYYKSDGEIDVIRLLENDIQAVEVKWAEQIRAGDLKELKKFSNSVILGKLAQIGQVDNIKSMPVYQFLYELSFVPSF